MGDVDAKRLLVENSRLKIQQNELSSILGEEKEMVKYLHGVIKNYEQLLRSNSKSKSSPRPAVLKRNHTDLDFDPYFSPREEIESVCSKSPTITTQPRKGDGSGRLMPLSEQQRNKTPLSSFKCLIKGSEEDVQRYSSYQKVNRPHIVRENVSRFSDGLSLENLENSSSSDEDSIKESIISLPGMSGCNPFENISLTSANFGEDSNEERPMESLVNTHSKKGIGHKYNKESHSERLVEHDSRNVHSIWDSYTSGHSESDIHTKASPPRKSKLIYTKAKQDAPPINQRGKTLQEINRELDKMDSKLNKYEKSLVKSEKRLSKMENRVEYLESFALGEESEWL